MEVKQQDEEEESDTGSCSKGGKLSNLKTEEKPVKSEVKKEECPGEGGKGVPMDTSTTTPMASVKTEDRKPEVKKEVKEEEETSDTTTPQATVKKKSKEDLSFYQKTSQCILNFLSPCVCVCVCVYVYKCFHSLLRFLFLPSIQARGAPSGPDAHT